MLTEPQITALRWIVGKLNEHAVPYQMVGGLAAIAHGATRPLADIDLYIDYTQAALFLADIAEYVYWGPKHEKDAHWDITYLKLNYAGQKIEIGDSNGARLFDMHAQQWIPQGIYYGLSAPKTVADIHLSVMPATQLIAYKKALNREVDAEDVRAIHAAITP